MRQAPKNIGRGSRSTSPCSQVSPNLSSVVTDSSLENLESNCRFDGLDFILYIIALGRCNGLGFYPDIADTYGVVTTPGESARKVLSRRTMSGYWNALSNCIWPAMVSKEALGSGRICATKASPAARIEWPGSCVRPACRAFRSEL